MSNQSIFDESIMTGEPLPAEKLMGVTVIGEPLTKVQLLHRSSYS